MNDRPDYATASEVESRLKELRDRLERMDEQHRHERFPDSVRAEWNGLVGERKALEQQLAEMHTRREYLESIDPNDPERTENSDRRFEQRNMALVNGDRGRSEALRCNERASFLPERAREHMERMLRDEKEPESQLVSYTRATSDRGYFRAYAKWFNDPQQGPVTWTQPERDAVSRVKEVARAMNLGTGSQGGFLVPYELDPNIVITAAYKDPMREISRVVTTALNTKKYVTSAGATSSWDPESTEVSDDTPTLAQPSIDCKKAMTFIPVSFELFEDSAIAQEVANLFADSKAQHESLSFTLSQTNGPVGLVSAIVAAGGAQVIATGTNAVAAADAYNNQNGLAARWRQNAKWMCNLAITNAFRQLPKSASVAESIVDDSGPQPKMLGWTIHENSNMDGSLSAAAADYSLISGDFKQYVIQDRVGASTEVVPVLVGANRRPTGERGFLQHWRVGADALVPSAFQLTNWSG